ncbi:hypothetical protein OG787_28315 [Streptomyces sp. NBC_00075]|uniref:hypothetical protein n=1 Tax=Streptomyces sp. NBC_00075 TaxID=2975641 RepID=UPI0032430DF6
MNVGVVPGFAQDAVSSLDGKNLQETRVRLRAVDQGLLDDQGVVLVGRRLDGVGVQDHLLAPRAGPAGDARHPGVLRGQALGRDPVLAARPDAGGGVEDDGLVAEDVSRGLDHGHARPKQQGAVDGEERVRAYVPVGLRLVPGLLEGVQLGHGQQLVALDCHLGVGEGGLDDRAAQVALRARRTHPAAQVLGVQVVEEEVVDVLRLDAQVGQVAQYRAVFGRQ